MNGNNTFDNGNRDLHRIGGTMIDYKEVSEMLNSDRMGTYLVVRDNAVEIAKALRDCRNELCNLCGNYLEADEASCKGCRWND